MSPRSRIVSWLSLICVVLAILALSAATRPPVTEARSGHEAPVAPASPDPAPVATGTTPAPEVVPAAGAPVRESFLTADREVSPMLEAIRDAWQEHQVVRTRLEEELAATSHPTAALAVQRRLEAAMRDLELRILRIQVDFARREGRTEVAERLETAIERMISPPTLPSPPERPAPGGDR